ncbi:MAG: GTPase HflX, partial [Bdellovibrionota bacterium]
MGVLVDRRGRVQGVSVGTPHRIQVPDFERSGNGQGRLAGVRFLHTHPSGNGLDGDDLSDLALLRLDAVAALTADEQGRPAHIEMGMLRSDVAGWSGSAEGRIHRTGLLPPHKLPSDFLTGLLELEKELARRARELSPA